ncbi:ATP-binding protein [Candidatus Williamhamiltonella defendens]|uniref:ATP-binding protein n=1 Tax=Candidatus Williamhamiltonella defendens TaxID=138072 RepID=A0A2D3TBF4_9ENTR|nr:ATP-binding protein [Candidatus Hamiltonella defensa]ATW33140.1 ATP-binding protein [Candidatus Hamiltonella defensa]
MDSIEVRNLAVIALKDNTDAEDRVYSPRDWPTRSDLFPLILIQTHSDDKKGIDRNVPKFNTTTTLRITARVEEFDGESNEDGAMNAEVKLEELQEQILKSLINSYELTRRIEKYSSVSSRVDIDSSGEGHIGQLLMLVSVEYFQGPDDFYPVISDDRKEVDMTLVIPDGTTQPKVKINFEG